MARAESKQIMGFLSLEERHYPALLSLVAPVTSAVRLLSVGLGVEAWTRLIAGGVEQRVIALPSRLQPEST